MKGISLFSGMGGDTLGLKMAGIDVVAFSEKIPIIRKTHLANFPDCEIIGSGVNSDITKITDPEFQKYQNDVDIIFAGFPCQGFSNAGKKKLNDPRNTLFREFVRATENVKPKIIIGENVKGLQTRKTITDEHIEVFKNTDFTDDEDVVLSMKNELESQGVTELFKLLENKKINNIDFSPDKYKLMEEVGIIKKLLSDAKSVLKAKSKDNANTDSEKDIVEKYKKLNNIALNIQINFIDIIKNSFENLSPKYKVISRVFKCHKYGVPQKRERLIILGIREDCIEDFNLSFPDETTDDVPNLKDIVKFSMEGTKEMDKELFEKMKIPKECILTDMNNNQKEQNPHPYLKLKATAKDVEYKGKTHKRLLSFAKRDSPIHCEIIDIRNASKTIICTYDHQPRLFVPIRNKKGYFIRCLLPDELKQIQGFPADFKVLGSKKQKIVQIGNAVPPPLIEKIVRHILKN